MCGIAGIFDFRGHSEIDRGLLRRMTDILYHRGPDGDGFHYAPGIGLGHRRLAIVDLATGDQPLFNEDGTVCVVYNGEIYNFQPLMAELKALGHVFRTRCDTEVIVHAWEEWGKACLDRFNGQFAFALWDAREERLFLARDRLGEKPLYYSLLSDGRLLFASELKSLLLSPQLDRPLDPQAIEEFFAYGYIPDPRSIYLGVRKLAPAHCLLVRRGEPVPEPRSYWDVRFVGGTTAHKQEIEEELITRLRASVRMRMIADVPLGAFLSGGVDSSGVVAMMAGLKPDPVSTFSIAFGAKGWDESHYAAQIAERYRTDHHVKEVDPNSFDLLERLATIYDEPFGDSSAMPTFRVCAMARENVTVALSGDGGDEVFAGYRRYPGTALKSVCAAWCRKPCAVPCSGRSAHCIQNSTGRHARCAPRRHWKSWRATRWKPIFRRCPFVVPNFGVGCSVASSPANCRATMPPTYCARICANATATTRCRRCSMPTSRRIFLATS
jgi:asparagine synthase (glutamine-hydrolysing)